MDKKLKNFLRIWRRAGRLGGKARGKAFTLIELLLVVAVIAILASLSSVAFNSVAFGSSITQAGGVVSGTLSQARQEAVARNQEVRVLFYKLPIPGEGTNWNAMQVFRVNYTNTSAVEGQPLSRLTMLPSKVIFSEERDLSPMLEADIRNRTTNLPTYGNVAYSAIRFMPDGSLPRKMTPTNNYITIVSRRDATNKKPDNYYCLQINPMTGKVMIYRP